MMISGSNATRDIISGNNGAYSARPGWDACTGLGSPDGARLLAALSSARHATADFSPIKNIVVVLQENHTFDNYFGTYPGVDGTQGKSLCLPKTPRSTTKCISPFHDANLKPVEMNHGWNAAHNDYNGGKMDGFVYSEGNRETMGYYDESDLPHYWKAAREYVLCERFFSSVMSQSGPNHLYLVAGTSGGIVNNNIPKTLTFRPIFEQDAAANNLAEAFDFSQPARAFRPI